MAGLDCIGYIINGKDRCIDLDHALWFMLGISMWKNIHIFFK